MQVQYSLRLEPNKVNEGIIEVPAAGYAAQHNPSQPR